jgi:proteasome lid subunit RPN8/RPN11
MSLWAVTEFCVPDHVVAKTNTVLRDAGRDKLEAFVVWGGIIEGPRFVVGSAIVPEQHSVRTREGLHVSIRGDALHQLGLAFSERGEIPGVQVHSHPDEAYHSEADDELAVVTKRGAVSIVVPILGRDGINGEGTAVYRLGAEGWSRVPRPVLPRLIRWGCDGSR